MRKAAVAAVALGEYTWTKREILYTNGLQQTKFQRRWLVFVQQRMSASNSTSPKALHHQEAAIFSSRSQPRALTSGLRSGKGEECRGQTFL